MKNSENFDANELIEVPLIHYSLIDIHYSIYYSVFYT